MIFMNQEHGNFYKKTCAALRIDGDREILALVYTLGMEDTTRRHFSELFSMKDGCIKPDAIDSPWQYSQSKCITRLAFDLYNGNQLTADSVYDHRKEDEERAQNAYDHELRMYSISNVFAYVDRRFIECMFQAIALRFGM